jgi:hypothetical protein
VAPHVEGRPSKPPRSLRYKMADELEPPTLEEMRVAIDSMAPPRNRVPWGWIGAGAVAAAAIVVAAVVVTRAETKAPVAVVSTAIPPVPSASSPAPPRQVMVRTIPAAQLLKDGAALGTTPTTVSVDPAAHSVVHYTLKAAGYADQDVVIGPDTGPEVNVELTKLAAAPPPPPAVPTAANYQQRPRPPQAPPHAPTGPESNLPDPFK